MPLQFIDSVLQQYREHVLRPRLNAARESCAAGRLALQSLFEIERLLQLLGHPQAGEFQAEASQLIPVVARRCITEEYELCRDEHIVHRILLAILQIERQIQLFGIRENPEVAQVMAEAEDLAAKCLRFELVFESEATTVQMNDQKQVSEVKSTVELAYQPGESQIRGEAPLENIRFDYHVPPVPGCTWSGETGPATTMVVNSLSFEVVHEGPDDLIGRVGDINLGYLPGASHEKVTASCLGTTNTAELPLWSLVFGQAHLSQAQAGQGIVATRWSIKGGELFAELAWEESSLAGTENGSFQLYHRPQ